VPDEGGVVAFATRYDADVHAVCIAVSDNGCGIDPELLPTIFDVFVSTKGSRGTGLGLAVVRKLLEEQGLPDDAEAPTKLGNPPYPPS